MVSSRALLMIIASAPLHKVVGGGVSSMCVSERCGSMKNCVGLRSFYIPTPCPNGAATAQGPAFWGLAPAAGPPNYAALAGPWPRDLLAPHAIPLAIPEAARASGGCFEVFEIQSGMSINLP